MKSVVIYGVEVEERWIDTKSGERIRVYPIEVLTKILNKSKAKLKNLERFNIIPPTFKDSNNIQLYSRKQLEVIVRVCNEYGFFNDEPTKRKKTLKNHLYNEVNRITIKYYTQPTQEEIEEELNKKVLKYAHKIKSLEKLRKHIKRRKNYDGFKRIEE